MAGRRRRRGRVARRSFVAKTDAEPATEENQEPEPVPSTSRGTDEGAVNDPAVAGPSTSRSPNMCPKCSGDDRFPMCYRAICGAPVCEGAPPSVDDGPRFTPQMIAHCNRRIRREMVMTGNMSEMVTYMQRRLAQVGWRNAMMQKCREVILERGEEIKYEELYDGVKDYGRETLPLKLKLELFADLFRVPAFEVITSEMEDKEQPESRRKAEAKKGKGADGNGGASTSKLSEEAGKRAEDEGVGEDEELGEDEGIAGAEGLAGIAGAEGLAGISGAEGLAGISGAEGLAGIAGAEGGADEEIDVSNLDSLEQLQIYEVIMDEVNIADLDDESMVEVIMDETAMAQAILAEANMAQAARAEAARAEAARAEAARAEAARSDENVAEVAAVEEEAKEME
ncbi:uncharacterized protein LOC129960233 isoform X1 [Argiope bruennichi]|uniref:uncharacterized protein LOC129960233 isoform X1 n=1 Tax=Argiope bruennichi TaxID=94029 RepID=UPI0024941176|nr:uncharacterized protein LOC129960233 isoform X1 [Argiope bruennichi]